LEWFGADLVRGQVRVVQGQGLEWQG